MGFEVDGILMRNPFPEGSRREDKKIETRDKGVRAVAEG